MKFAPGLLLASALLLGQGTEYPAVKFRSNYLASYYLSHAPTTTPWAPAWSPDGKWLAVSLHGSIFKVDPKTGEAWELTHDRRLHSAPAWSPDGKWIVFTADDEWRSIQLAAVNVATGELRALTSDDQVYADPAFSPDGSRIAYVSTKGTGNLNLFMRSFRNGDWSSEPVTLSRDNDFGRGRQYFSNWDLHIEPTWLRNGEEMLIVSNRGVALGSGNLWRVPAAPDAMSKARPILIEQSLYRTRPDVAPDGKRLVYASTAGAADQFNHLYVLPVEGGQPYKITFGDFDDFHPRWSPDGEQIAYISSEGGLPELYLFEVNGGAKRKVEIGRKHWKTPMARVRVTITDSEGRPTAARVSGHASDGKLWAASTAYVFNARLASGLKRVYYAEGSYEVDVPAGPFLLEVTKGFEFKPVREEVQLTAGQTKEIRAVMRPNSDMAARGWFNGSTHVHMNYGGNIRNTPERLMQMARAQGMHIVSGLVANKDNRILDWQYFQKGGGAHPVSDLARHSLLIFGEENRPPFWGHTFYIGLRDHLISPFFTGYEGTGVDSLYPSNTDLFRRAREQGAATGYVHAFGGEGDPSQGNGLGGAKGYAVDVALGTIDALEWSSASRGSLIPLFHAWNNDFRIAPVGGEDALANMQDHRPVGIIRTYAWLGNDFSADGWVNAIKKGHTYLSSGPVCDFRVSGKIPGDEIRLPAAGEVEITGEAFSLAPIRKVVIYRDGKPWKQVGEKFSEKARVDSSTWFSLVVEADEIPQTSPTVYAQAATNCVRVYVGGKPIRNAESARYFINWIAKLRAVSSSPSLWRSERERAHVFAQFDEAVRVYERRMAE